MKDVREPPLVRTSERNDHAHCPQMWEWGWLQGLKPVREPTWSVFGIAWHRAMEVRYPVGRRRGKLVDCVDMFLESLDDLGRKVGVDINDLEEAEAERLEEKGRKVKLVPARELGPLMLEEYIKYYRDDRDWEVVHSEQTFQIDVPDPRDKSRILLVLAGTWDLLIWNRAKRRYELVDHKTAKQIPGWGYLDLDNQAGTYPWVAKEVLVHKGILTKKDNIRGIWFSFAKKSPPDPRPVNAAGESLNKDGTVSKMQPAKRFERYYSPRTVQQNVGQARRVQKQGLIMEGMRDGTLPIYKTPNKDCERCAFFDMCTLEEQGDDWEFYRDEMYKYRDPYRDHREDMERNGIEIRR